MKKIIGFLGVAVIAATMFFNTNKVNSFNSDISLSSLMNLNVANAQSEMPIPPCEEASRPIESRTHFLLSNHGSCYNKDGDECGQFNQCTTGNKLPNIPNVSSECTPVKCT